MNVLELFAGIGGMTLGLERAGMTAIGFVEIDPWCRRVLARHWPDVPQHDDVRTAVQWWRSEPRPVVDVMSGGYPCQPDSTAGPRRGTKDPRWLWPDMARVIQALKPRYVIGENVAGHRTRGLCFVLRDLERLGYTARAGLIRACTLGAPHARSRLFILAESQCERWTRPEYQAQTQVPAGWTTAQGSSWWTIKPGVDRVAYGVSGRVDRLRGIGNAVVPQVAEHMGRLLLSGEWHHV